MLRINLFTYGDASDVNTWSNLPFYFQRALRGRDVQVTPIDIAPPNQASAATRASSAYARLASLFGRPTPNDPFRTRLNYRLTDERVAAAARRHADADLNLFMTFSFSSYKHASTPVVLYCDRSYEQHLEDKGQIATRADRAFIEIDRANIEQAALVLTTSRVCRDFIQRRYESKRVVYLQAGLNAELGNLDADGLIAQKERSRDILFIGRGAHKRGVDVLLDAFARFNQRQTVPFTLHIVGVRPDELPSDAWSARPDVLFHGYLDRTVAAEQATYDALMQSARLFVFPMRPGPVAGVIREAQWNCTPVIISGVPGTAERVAHDKTGVIADTLEPEEFARHMEALVSDLPRWRRLARNAHTSIGGATWSATADNFLRILEESGLMPSTPR